MLRAVFLDRDGVLNPLVRRPPHRFDSPYCLEEFELFPWAGKAVRAIKQLGYLTVITSNQPGVALGYCTPDFLEALNQKMAAQLEPWGAQLDAIYYCYHHPQGTVAPYGGPCECRKPAPGMLRRASQELGVDLAASFMIGDSEKDIAAGKAAGCQTILLGWQAHHSPELRRSFSPSPQAMAANLWEAVPHIQSFPQGGRR